MLLVPESITFPDDIASRRLCCQPHTEIYQMLFTQLSETYAYFLLTNYVADQSTNDVMFNVILNEHFTETDIFGFGFDIKRICKQVYKKFCFV